MTKEEALYEFLIEAWNDKKTTQARYKRMVKYLDVLGIEDRNQILWEMGFSAFIPGTAVKV